MTKAFYINSEDVARASYIVLSLEQLLEFAKSDSLEDVISRTHTDLEDAHDGKADFTAFNAAEAVNELKGMIRDEVASLDPYSFEETATAYGLA